MVGGMLRLTTKNKKTTADRALPGTQEATKILQLIEKHQLSTAKSATRNLVNSAVAFYDKNEGGDIDDVVQNKVHYDKRAHFIATAFVINSTRSLEGTSGDLREMSAAAQSYLKVLET